MQVYTIKDSAMNPDDNQNSSNSQEQLSSTNKTTTVQEFPQTGINNNIPVIISGVMFITAMLICITMFVNILRRGDS